MKKILVVVALLVVIVGVFPFVGGFLLERTVHKAVEDLNLIYTNTSVGYSVEIVSYDRGYLTSDFECKINMGALKNVLGIESVRLKEHARHGYSGVVSTTSLEENAWFNSFVDDKLQGQDPLHIQTVYSLFGGIESTVDLDPFSVMVEGEELDVKQGEIVISTDRTLKNLVTLGNWQGISVGEKISVGESSLASDLEMISEFIWKGDAVFHVKNLSAINKDGEFDLVDMKLQYLLEADKDANTMGGEVFFSVAKFQVKDKKVDDASVRFAVKGINSNEYEEFMKSYSHMISKIMADIKSNDKDNEKNAEIMKQEIAKIGFQIMSGYEKLLKEGLEVRISDLHFKLPDGEVKGDITLRLLKDMTFMQFVPIVYQPQLLLDIFHVKSTFSMPAKLVGENPKLLTPVYPGMKTGLFIKDGDNLVHRAEAKDGKLFLNGKEVVLDRTALEADLTS